MAIFHENTDSQRPLAEIIGFIELVIFTSK